MKHLIIPADVPNRNKRIYPRETLVKALGHADLDASAF